MKIKKVIVRNYICWHRAEGVMLRHSKHGGKGLSAPILREPQDDSALLRYMILMGLLLLFSTSAWSQVKDSLAVTNFHDVASLPNRTTPLIVIDDVPYPNNYILNPKDIKKIEILSEAAGYALYGSQASEGVIYVTTKKHGAGNLGRMNLFVDTNAMFVIDGKPSPNKLTGLDPREILSITILNRVAKDPSLNTGINTEVLVVTKRGAIKAYQKKFSAFSKKYQSYLDNTKSDDSNLLYKLNEAFVNQNSSEGVKTLFDIQSKNIKKVTFLKDTIPQFSKISLVVVIKTKK